MSVQIVLDVTDDFNADSDVKLDTGGLIMQSFNW